MSDKTAIVMRFPQDVKAWLQAQADLHGSSQNSEAIRAIRERMDRIADQREGRERASA
jgi:poly(3-hydroxybutyrate) depolymerase